MVVVGVFEVTEKLAVYQTNDFVKGVMNVMRGKRTVGEEFRDNVVGNECALRNEMFGV